MLIPVQKKYIFKIESNILKYKNIFSSSSGTKLFLILFPHYGIILYIKCQPFQGVKNKHLTSGCHSQPFLMLSAGDCHGLLQKPPDIAELR